MKKTIEDVINLTIADGESTGSIDFTPLDGSIVGVFVFTPDSGLGNAGFVNAGIKDSHGDYISKLQDIRNYKKGDGEYLKSAKPMYVKGGKPMSFNVIATEPFDKQFNCQLILVYEDPNECNY